MGGYRGIMENNMETTQDLGAYGGYIGFRVER